MRFAIRVLAMLWLIGTQQAALGQKKIQLLGHDERPQVSYRDVAFSPDGKLLASSANDGSVFVWDANTGALLQSLKHSEDIGHVEFSPDGRQLAACQFSYGRKEGTDDSATSVLLWDTTSWEKKEMLFPGKHGCHVEFAYLKNGDIVTCFQSAFKSGSKLQRWTSYGENAELIFESDKMQFRVLVVSPDGKRLVAYTTDEGRNAAPAMLWDTGDFHRPRIIKGHYWPLVFSPDSRLLAGCEKVGDRWESPARVILWNVADMREVDSLSGFTGRATVISFSRDGRFLAASATMPGGWGEVWGEKVQVWDLMTGEQRLMEENTHAQGLEFSPTNDVLASSFATPMPGIRLRDTKTGEVASTMPFGEPRKNVIVKLRFSPLGDRFATVAAHSDQYDSLCIWVLNE